MLDTSSVIVLGRVSDPAQLPDDCAISAIATTALANDLPLFTCDPSDFAGVDGLELHAVSAEPLPST